MPGEDEYQTGDDNDETSEAPDVEEPEDVVQGSGERVGRLPDGSGFLVLEGPGAGTVVTATATAKVSEVPTLPTRDDALRGEVPIFLLHRPFKYWRALPRLIASVHADTAGNIVLGTVSKMSGFSDDSHFRFHESCGAAALKIVDPEGYYATRADLRLNDPSQRRIDRVPHLGGSPLDIADLLQAQRVRGANVLLTPGRALDSADPQRSLDTAFSDGDDALALLNPGERLILNLTMSTTWLTRRPLRDRLLGQLLDQEQFDSWYVRVQWPQSLRSQSQPTDEELLRGYRRLAELAADEERALLLPQSGLTGWLMLAFGANGFGTGLGGSGQAFREEGGGGPTPRIERYFERQLLHTIERTARPLLTTDPSYEPCRCPYCPALFAGEAWSEEYESLHQAYNYGLLTAAAAPASAGRGGAHAAIRRAVRRAVALAEGKGLTGLSEPRHLGVWDRVV